eukprot:COSAG02_NODE_8422_length_2573_cov_2.646489_2_plen_356_part_00
MHAIREITMDRDARLTLVENNLRRLRANDPKMKEVIWRYAGVVDEDVLELAKALEGNSHVRFVDLSGNEELTDASTDALLDVAPRCKFINAMVENTGMDRIRMNDVLTRLQREEDIVAIKANDPQKTQVIWLGRTVPTSNAEIARLADTLDGNTFVQTVVLSNSRELTDITRLLEVGERTGATSVRMYGTNIPPEQQKQMKMVAASNARRRLAANDPALKILDWVESDITDEHINMIAEGLPGNNMCQELRLSENKYITDLSKLIKALPKCGVVSAKVWRLDNAPLEQAREVRKIALATALRRLRADDPLVTEINWARYGCTNSDLAELAPGFDGNTHCTCLDIGTNPGLNDAGK